MKPNQKKQTIKTGDTVTLNSGGDVMTVGYNSGTHCECYWFSNSFIYCEILDNDMLTIVDRPKLTITVEVVD